MITRKNVISGGITTVALILGIVIGAFASGSGDASAAPTPTATTTTVTAPTPAAETVTTPTVPDSCIKALDAADALRHDTVEFGHAILPFPRLVLQAAQAGASFDADGIRAVTARMRSITAKVNAVNGSVTGHVATFEQSGSACRAAR